MQHRHLRRLVREFMTRTSGKKKSHQLHQTHLCNEEENEEGRRAFSLNSRRIFSRRKRTFKPPLFLHFRSAADRPDVLALLKAPTRRDLIAFRPIFIAPLPARSEFHVDSTEDADQMTWMRVVSAARYLDVAEETIARRLVSWSDRPTRFRIRTRTLEGSWVRGATRCFKPDIDGLLCEPVSCAGAKADTARFHED